jgi:hypothetical protein
MTHKKRKVRLYEEDISSTKIDSIRFVSFDWY